MIKIFSYFSMIHKIMATCMFVIVTTSLYQNFFAGGQELYCVYYAESGTDTYVTVYNNDNTTVTNPTTYRFTCLVSYKSLHHAHEWQK